MCLEEPGGRCVGGAKLRADHWSLGWPVGAMEVLEGQERSQEAAVGALGGRARGVWPHSALLACS